MTTRRDSIGLPTIFSELKSAAITTTAVPCWSSWKTGMSSSSRRRSSISKQRGAEMSSRLMPPKVGAISSTVSMIFSGSLVSRADREGVDVGELLEEHRLALHHGHRGLGADVAEAEHGAAVGDDRDGVLLDRELEGLGAVLGDLGADAGDARACRPSRGRRGSSAGTCCAARSCRRGASRRCGRCSRGPWRRGSSRSRAGSAPSARGSRASIVNSRTRLPSAPAPGTRSTDCRAPPALGDRAGDLAERLVARVELDADGDRELCGDVGHGCRWIIGAGDRRAPSGFPRGRLPPMHPLLRRLRRGAAVPAGMVARAASRPRRRRRRAQPARAGREGPPRGRSPARS